MSGIKRAQPPRWVLSGTLFHGGINLLLSGLCPEPTRGVWSPLRSPQMWGWKTLQILLPKSVAGLSLSFFPAPPPFFSDLLSFVLFVLNYAHFLAVKTLLQSIFAQSTLVLLISFVHIHCTTYSVFKFTIFVLDFLFNTFLYSKYIVSWTIFYCPYLVKNIWILLPHLLICWK